MGIEEAAIEWVTIKDSAGREELVGVDVDGEVLVSLASIKGLLLPPETERVVKDHGTYLRAEDIVAANPGLRAAIELRFDLALKALWAMLLPDMAA